MPSSEHGDRDSSQSDAKPQEIIAKVDALERERERRRLTQRPLGVTLFAALLACYVIAVAVLVVSRWIHWDTVRLWVPDDDLFDFVLASFILVPISAALAAALCYGLWNLQEWSRHAMSAGGVYGFLRRAYAAGVAGLSVHGFRGSRQERSVLLEAILLLLIAAYFQTPTVAAAFRAVPGNEELTRPSRS